MLYRNPAEPSCACCAHARPLDEESAICLRRGIVHLTGYCARFSYDPLKRVPETPRALPKQELLPEDFQL